MSTKSKAIVITRFPYESEFGGEESHTLTLARYLKQQGYEVVFLGSCPVLLERFSAEGFPVKKVWGGKMIVSPWQLFKSFFLFPFIIWNLKRHFKQIEKQYDIKAAYLLSFNEKIFLTPYLLHKNIPVTWVEHQELRNWFLKNPWTRLYKKYSSYVRIIPIGKNNLQILEKIGVLKTSLQEIVHGIDSTLFQKERNTQKNLIVTANRDIPKKGISDLKRALELLQRNDLEIRIITNFLKKENWYDLLLRTDIYVHPARDRSETFSINCAEALAAGCKLVVTSCSGIADYLTDREHAFIVEPNHPKDLARGILQALSAPDEMRSRARRNAQTSFDLSHMLQQYHAVILRS